MSAININKNNFENEVLNSDKPVLLDFWASWCAPCRMVVPIVEEIASERRDIKVGKINVDEEPELANKFSIMSIPTLVVMKNGKQITVAAMESRIVFIFLFFKNFLKLFKSFASLLFSFVCAEIFISFSRSAFVS